MRVGYLTPATTISSHGSSSIRADRDRDAPARTERGLTLKVLAGQRSLEQLTALAESAADA